MSESVEESSSFLKCTVISCSNFYQTASGPQDRKFFNFPSERQIAKVWKEKCGVAADHSVAGAKVCAEHFKPTDYARKNVLKSDAVPKDNLDWMFGHPEIKLDDLINPRPATPSQQEVTIDEVKEQVDLHEKQNARLSKLLKDEELLNNRIAMYNTKIENVDKELVRLKGMIGKFGFKRGKNGTINTNLINKVFSPAQINILLGKKKVVWSGDDMAMAFTLRHLGKKECYLYLKNTLNMPLPALSAVQRWMASI